MALPKSEEKYKAILDAAAVVADEGINAPTLRIAKLAGVAEGTIFRYFPTKDILLNELYLVIKQELADILQSSITENPRGTLSSFWHGYVNWGTDYPGRYKTMVQLSVAEKITEESRQKSSYMFSPMHSTVGDILKQTEKPAEFAMAIFSSMADTTIRFMLKHPEKRNEYADNGFSSLWAALTC